MTLKFLTSTAGACGMSINLDFFDVSLLLEIVKNLGEETTGVIFTPSLFITLRSAGFFVLFNYLVRVVPARFLY